MTRRQSMVAGLVGCVVLVAACSGGGSETAGDGTDGQDDAPTSTEAPTSSTSSTSSTSASASAEPSVMVVDPDDEPTETESSTDGSGVPPAEDGPLPDSGPAVAEALTRAEGAIRDPSVTDEAAAAWGRFQQRLYRHLARNPEWAADALDIDDPALRQAAELNWEARVNLEALLASHGPEANLPAWRVVAPRSVDELLGYYRDGQDQWGIDWQYLAAINLIETRMGRIEGLSSAGAVGPMQFLPTTWAECCEGDATNPADAIPGAARYLTIRGGPQNMERAIWGYNNSDNYVAAVSAYAEVLRQDELAYRGYHAWQIFFASTEGLLLIPVGYEESEPIPAAEWLVDNPQYLLG